MLRLMRRPGSADKYLILLDQLRTAMPDVAIRTTLMTGFPGETAERFNAMMTFVRNAQFDRLGVFDYSKEENTSAYDLGDQVPHKTAIWRRDKLMAAQQPISLSINRSYIGKELDVLIERTRDNISVGRSYRDAPEVDGAVVVHDATVKPGTMIRVRVTSAMPYDLHAVALTTDY
jgi:ribosomal protein S12 methylthiotransferase